MMRGQMRTEAPCDWRSTVDRHFDRRIQPADEAALRAHLPDCARCRHRYDRHLLMRRLLPRPRAGLDRQLRDAEDRLAVGLGLGERPAALEAWPRWRWALATAAVGMGVLLLSGLPDRTGRAPATATDEPTPAEAQPRVGVQQHADGRLTVFYGNGHWRQLAIAGVGAAGEVTVLQAGQAIAGPVDRQALPQRIAPGRAVRLVALFSDQPLDERAVAEAARGTGPLATGIGVRLEVPLTPPEPPP